MKKLVCLGLLSLIFHSCGTQKESQAELKPYKIDRCFTYNTLGQPWILLYIGADNKFFADHYLANCHGGDGVIVKVEPDDFLCTAIPDGAYIPDIFLPKEAQGRGGRWAIHYSVTKDHCNGLFQNK